MSTHWKAVLGVILIFVLGFTSGVVTSSIFAERKLAQFLKRPGVALMNAMEHRLTRNITLDPDQKTQIHGLFMDNLRQHKQLQAQIQPQVAQLNRSTVQQIRAVLRPDQQQVFDKNLADLQNRFWKYANSQEPAGTDPSPPPAPQSPSVGTPTNAAPAAGRYKN